MSTAKLYVVENVAKVIVVAMKQRSEYDKTFTWNDTNNPFKNFLDKIAAKKKDQESRGVGCTYY